MQGRQSVNLDTSRNSIWHVGVSRASSGKQQQLPPLSQHKTNIIEMILTSKCSKLNSNDMAMEMYSDLGRMLAEPQYGSNKLVIKR
jgi:hypothetical protein